MTAKSKNIVFWVDPKRLSVKSCDITKIDETIKNHESFISDDEPCDYSFFIEDLPKEVKGVYCFGSEEEAHSFVKIQIGM